MIWDVLAIGFLLLCVALGVVAMIPGDISAKLKWVRESIKNSIGGVIRFFLVIIAVGFICALIGVITESARSWELAISWSAIVALVLLVLIALRCINSRRFWKPIIKALDFLIEKEFAWVPVIMLFWIQYLIEPPHECLLEGSWNKFNHLFSYISPTLFIVWCMYLLIKEKRRMVAQEVVEIKPLAQRILEPIIYAALITYCFWEPLCDTCPFFLIILALLVKGLTFLLTPTTIIIILLLYIILKKNR